MKQPAPGFVRHPTGLASALVSISVLALPRSFRARYREEFCAELCTLPIGRQITVAVGVLTGSLSLRHALEEDQMSITPRHTKPLRCKIGRHHFRLINDNNPEDRRIQHLECLACGRIKEIGWDYVPPDAKWLAGGMGGMG